MFASHSQSFNNVLFQFPYLKFGNIRSFSFPLSPSSFLASCEMGNVSTPLVLACLKRRKSPNLSECSTSDHCSFVISDHLSPVRQENKNIRLNESFLQ